MGKRPSREKMASADTLAEIEAIKARKFTQGRADMLADLMDDLDFLENGPKEEPAPAPAPAAAAVRSSSPVAAAREEPSPRSRRAEPSVSQTKDANRAAAGRMAIVGSKWPEPLEKKKVVVVWDFNNTLVPWYKMKRGATEKEKELFEEWMALSEEIQREALRGHSTNWENAETVDGVG